MPPLESLNVPIFTCSVLHHSTRFICSPISFFSLGFSTCFSLHPFPFRLFFLFHLCSFFIISSSLSCRYHILPLSPLNLLVSTLKTFPLLCISLIMFCFRKFVDSLCLIVSVFSCFFVSSFFLLFLCLSVSLLLLLSGSMRAQASYVSKPLRS